MSGEAVLRRVGAIPDAAIGRAIGSLVAGDTVVLRVERDGAPVEPLADGRSAGRVEPEADIRPRPVDTVRLVPVPESRSPFGERPATRHKR